MRFITLYLGKMGTLLSDRRALTYALAVVAALLGIPYAVDAQGLDSEVVKAVVAVVQGLVVLVGYMDLVRSWDKRLPSGLKYKDILELEMQIKQTIISILNSDEPDMQSVRDLLISLGFKPETLK